MPKVIAFLRDETAASAAEYALLLAVVGAGVTLGVLFLGQAIGGAMNGAGDCIAHPNSSNC
jgi:pilus assembly protein Flp/PilA